MLFLVKTEMEAENPNPDFAAPAGGLAGRLWAAAKEKIAGKKKEEEEADLKVVRERRSAEEAEKDEKEAGEANKPATEAASERKKAEPEIAKDTEKSGGS